MLMYVFLCFSYGLQEMLGDLFLPCETPEAPKQGFFKNLFGGGAGGLDREELCKRFLGPYCESDIETISHAFLYCDNAIRIW